MNTSRPRHSPGSGGHRSRPRGSLRSIATVTCTHHCLRFLKEMLDPLRPAASGIES